MSRRKTLNSYMSLSKIYIHVYSLCVFIIYIMCIYYIHYLLYTLFIIYIYYIHYYIHYLLYTLCVCIYYIHYVYLLLYNRRNYWSFNLSIFIYSISRQKGLQNLSRLIYFAIYLNQIRKYIVQFCNLVNNYHQRIRSSQFSKDKTKSIHTRTHTHTHTHIYIYMCVCVYITMKLWFVTFYSALDILKYCSIFLCNEKWFYLLVNLNHNFKS